MTIIVQYLSTDQVIPAPPMGWASVSQVVYSLQAVARQVVQMVVTIVQCHGIDDTVYGP